MAHDHDHGHGHQHHHHGQLPAGGHLNKAFIMGIILNLVFVVIEFGAGFFSQSLALISDAGHNLMDVASLGLSLLAFRLAKVKPNETFTFGYRKSTILASMFNAIILLVGMGFVAYEAIERIGRPEIVKGNVVAIVASIGIVVNAATALLFFRDKEHDLNVKGAYLHMVADALVSLGAVVVGVIIIFTHWYWLDAVVSIAIIIVIVVSTWHLLSDSLKLAMDAVPEGIEMDKVKAVALKINGVKAIHHIHIWGMSTTENALTAQVLVDSTSSMEAIENIKKDFRHEMEHLNIQHVTIETELNMDTDTCCD
ncbi:cobalt-zinc-cadmium efflux system protein [Chitinophaga costaii]|uniref:Cobalt-zinc-cadmium efflux system protein n=1 Tax=Chitinophaga costaii TaxID=1335309 RepID=A0A1C4BY99_9BACT|nr:cation diffusion facilitator family transporter [Chitinophaga costaii]PUZ27425.1 cation transporter [Chitinophaga costaii]SCC11778.1 cobalt-zinc-cadmium efflux system protein [Chitinophaga costaii]